MPTPQPVAHVNADPPSQAWRGGSSGFPDVVADNEQRSQGRGGTVRRTVLGEQVRIRRWVCDRAK